ncbi:hypothetical protein ACIGKR_12190 [Rhodococcus qingshengii]|uniref:hypothetical protein n=1 Tax=Rhodococcus qingshengii TaxID=334542 RepID=UPI0037C632BC
MTVDPRMHPVKKHLRLSLTATRRDSEIAHLQLAVTALVNIVETLLPEPEPPAPTPEDLAAMEAAGVGSFEDAHAKLFGTVDDRVRVKVNEQRGAWWQAQGSGSTVGARVMESRVDVQHPTVARIKFADGGVVGQSSSSTKPDARERNSAELILRHNAELEKKNDQIANLKTRIFNQRSELAVLNGKQSENAQVMGWLAAIANADKDVEAGLAAGKALSEFAQTLRAA